MPKEAVCHTHYFTAELLNLQASDPYTMAL